jgi:DNA-binding SARP family transcriptional activator
MTTNVLTFHVSLTVRTIEHPGHERSWIQLMLALYRSDRRAQALATFAAARQALIEESGIEPGPAMKGLHRQILRDDPGLDLMFNSATSESILECLMGRRIRGVTDLLRIGHRNTGK